MSNESSIKDRNHEAYWNTVVEKAFSAVKTINGKETNLTLYGNIFERGMMDMMGVKGVGQNYPATVELIESAKEEGMTQMGIKGMKPEDVKKFTDELNKKYGAGTAIDTGAGLDEVSGIQYEHSIRIPISALAEKITPDFARHLETTGRENPALIREFQLMVGSTPDFMGPKEDRVPSIAEQILARNITKTPDVILVINKAAFSELTETVNAAADVINGKQTGITMTTGMIERGTGIAMTSGVFERGTMSMLGVEGVSEKYPASVQISPSKKEEGMMFMDIKGMKDEDVKKYVGALNKKYGEGTAVDTGAVKANSWQSYEHSIKIPMAAAIRMAKDLDGHLETIGRENPDLIRALQTRSSVALDFQGPNEDSVPPIAEQREKQNITKTPAAFSELRETVNAAADVINGKQTGITMTSDVFERGTMSMMGIKGVSEKYPASVSISPSKKEDEMMSMDIKGMKDEDVKKYVDALNKKYGAGTAVDTGPFRDDTGQSYEHSIKIPMAAAIRMTKDLDGHLETMGRENPSLIRALQTQSGAVPDFQGPNKTRQPPEKVKKHAFDDFVDKGSVRLAVVEVPGGHGNDFAPKGTTINRGQNARG